MIQRSVVQFRNPLKSGQGVVVSPRLVLTALHGQCDNGVEFEIKSLSDIVRVGKVDVVCFEENKVDMALLRLQDGQPQFEHWLDVMNRPLQIQERVSVLSLQRGLLGSLGFSSQATTIFMFDPDTTLCRAQYYAMDGLSGSGVITESQSDGLVRVVGVHVASHDDTDSPPPIKKNKEEVVDAGSVSASSDSLARQLHGHSSYCLICVANLVPEIMLQISSDNYI